MLDFKPKGDFDLNMIILSRAGNVLELGKGRSRRVDGGV